MDYKIKILDINTIQRKGELLAIFSGIPFFILQIIVNVLLISNIIPFSYLIEPLIFGSSLIIGAIPALKIYKKNAFRKKLQRYSKAPTQKEIIEEKTRYEITREKIINSNKILSLILNDLQKKKELIEQGYVKQKGNDKLEQININSKNLIATINSYMEKIDILSVKTILKHFLDEGYISFYEIASSLVVGTFLSICFLLPNIVTQIVNAFHVIITFLGTYLVTAGVLTRLNKDKRIVCEKINNELGEEALSKTNMFDFSNKENEKELSLEDLIKKVSQLRLQLEEELIKKAELEDNIINENKEEQKNIKNPCLYDDCLFDELGVNNEKTYNDTYQPKERGMVLQKTRN